MAIAMFPESDAYASTNEATAQHKLGTKVEVYDATYGWRTYAYYYLTDSVSCTLGHVVTFSHDAVGYVTGDVSEGTGTVAGVALGAVTYAQHGWFVCGHGDHCYVLTDGAATALQSMIPHATNGEADDMSAGEEDRVFGVFKVANGTTTEAGTTAILTMG